MNTEQAKLIPAILVQARYGNVTLMTIHRWLAGSTGFPHPVKINGRNYWRTSDLDAFDAGLKTERGLSPQDRSKAAREREAA
jgi:hypothetical protein